MSLRRSWRRLPLLAGSLCTVFFGVAAQAGVIIDWVPVGDTENVDDTHGSGHGGVDYEYFIGRHEVTNGQYIDFLNAVAATDPHDLYNPNMGDEKEGGIVRTGAEGSYVYGPKNEDLAWLDRPINFVNFYDALRFANWLDNGQPDGAQNTSTTEDGAYDMSMGVAVSRKPGARVFLTSENEWYKAAYYQGGGANAGYWDYATRSDTAPIAELPPGAGNSANYDDAVGDPYYTTAVGSYASSFSAYRTFDQNGNLAEWNEAEVSDRRGVRGGSWEDDESHLRALFPRYYLPATETRGVGFRLAKLGDSDCNGWGTLDDHESFVSCLGGPSTSVPTICTCPNLDGDDDVDLADFAAYQNVFFAP